MLFSSVYTAWKRKYRDNQKPLVSNVSKQISTTAVLAQNYVRTVKGAHVSLRHIILFLCLCFPEKRKSTNIIKIGAKQEPVPGYIDQVPQTCCWKKKETKPYRNKPFLWSYFITCLHSKDLPDKSLVGSPFYIDDSVISRFILSVFKTSKQKHDKVLHYGSARLQGDSAGRGSFSCKPECLYSPNFWLSLRFTFEWTEV